MITKGDIVGTDIGYHEVKKALETTLVISGYDREDYEIDGELVELCCKQKDRKDQGETTESIEKEDIVVFDGEFYEVTEVKEKVYVLSGDDRDDFPIEKEFVQVCCKRKDRKDI